MSKPRIYHYDTTYEQEAADGTVTASVELRIYYTVTDSGKPTRDDPGWPAQAEFHSVGEEIAGTKPRQYRDIRDNHKDLTDQQSMADDILFWWAQDFVDEHQDSLLIAAGHDDEANADYAREMRDEMRREAP